MGGVGELRKCENCLSHRLSTGGDVFWPFLGLSTEYSRKKALLVFFSPKTRGTARRDGVLLIKRFD